MKIELSENEKEYPNVGDYILLKSGVLLKLVRDNYHGESNESVLKLVNVLYSCVYRTVADAKVLVVGYRTWVEDSSEIVRIIRGRKMVLKEIE